MQSHNTRAALADLSNELESLKPSESGCADEFSWAVKIERFRPVALQAGARAAQLTDILAVAMRPLRKTELSAQMSEGQVLQLEELSELAFKDRAADMPKIFECTRELSAIADAGLVHTLTTRLLRRLHLGTLVTEANAEQTYPVDFSARQLIHMLGIDTPSRGHELVLESLDHLEAVFKFLEFADLVAAAGTCRLWKAAAEGLRPEEAAWAALALEEYDI